jgi:hypothetical protein
MPDLKKLLLLICLALTACAGHRKDGPTPSSARPGAPAKAKGAETAELSFMKRKILSLAQREWDYFGRQTVLFDGEEESIPHVGMWEDDREAYVVRVNWYWRAVEKPLLTGNHCREPWSAAFISWIMKEAGLSEYEFPPAEAHWIYLTQIMAMADDPAAAFLPRGIREYPPQPGDLICATRGQRDFPLAGLELQPYLIEHTKLHCDIVVERNGDTIESIGGNVRNSVSKTVQKLDKNGFLQPTQRRPWFMVLENRL